MRRPESRSAVLARAQAHLADRGAQQQQQQDGPPGRRLPTARPSSSSSSSNGLFFLRMASDLSELSDASSATPGREKPAEGLSLGETTPPPRPYSRFLKWKPQKAITDVRQAGLDPATRTGLGATPTGRPSALLRKLVHIEDKIRNQKPGRDILQIVPMLDDETSVSESVHGAGQRAKGLQYLKRNAGPQEVSKAPTRDLPPRRDAGGEERHGRGMPTKSRGQEGLSGLMLGRKVPSPSGLQSSLPAQNSLKKRPLCSPSSPSSSALPLRDSSPPSGKGGPAGAASQSLSSICPRGWSPSEHSIVRSLDELFSEAADTLREASSSRSGSSSSSDFRVNVLSLDDLVPGAASQAEGLEMKATAVQKAGRPSKALGAALAPAVAQSPFAAPRISMGKTGALEEDPGETEISERLSSSSAGSSVCEEESLASAEYSEDLEPTASSAASETPPRPSSSLAGSGWPSDVSSLSCPLEGLRSTRLLHRVTVKDAAVQANGSSLAYHWLQTDVPVTLGQAEGGSSIEGPPITSPVLSLDVVEALTTYSPAAFALNDLLKQNVLLIQQFVEASRHLHASFVASLEEEDFHYHSLEEAKRYINRHKPRPLTMEQAVLQQVGEEQRRQQQQQMALEGRLGGEQLPLVLTREAASPRAQKAAGSAGARAGLFSPRPAAASGATEFVSCGAGLSRSLEEKPQRSRGNRGCALAPGSLLQQPCGR